MSKKIKTLELDALRKSFGGVKSYAIIEPLKVDAATDFEFRKRLRDKKIKVQMVKNTYAKKIFGEMGISVDSWAGPTLMCWGGGSVKELASSVETLIKELRKDPKAPAKFKVKTAVADGQVVAWDVAQKMPTREEAIGDVLNAILSAGSALAGALTGPAAQLAGILKAIEEKKPEEAAAPAPTPAA
ncbi:50S ribosomal protein L10 [Fimbriiglobus ruber]|uniref:Large ribosomal subunit protein uL10 n=1 Tax=Fimbriiglobus ruber TaxID=1908690 RepID=A0A225DBM7_9BACT|nr:50S ribosomal protein L10 [Fimbriiglobus ruber]OWK35928.1 LSU ribosomal protein L10p (P0) [Fimbriiglobus ruber]